MHYLAIVLTIYFFSGIVSAYFNHWLVMERKSIIEKFHRLRLKAFQNNFGILIEFNPDVYRIGFDADEARKIVSDEKVKKYLSDEGFNGLVATAIFLCGFINILWLRSDYKYFNKLRESYQQAESLVEERIGPV